MHVSLIIQPDLWPICGNLTKCEQDSINHSVAVELFGKILWLVMVGKLSIMQLQGSIY